MLSQIKRRMLPDLEWTDQTTETATDFRNQTIEDAKAGAYALQSFVWSLPGSDTQNAILDISIRVQPTMGTSNVRAEIQDKDGHRITWSVRHAR